MTCNIVGSIDRSLIKLGQYSTSPTCAPEQVFSNRVRVNPDPNPNTNTCRANWITGR